MVSVESTYTENSSLVLADGNIWTIGAGDDYGVKITRKLTKTMQLTPASNDSPPLMLIKNGTTAERQTAFLQTIPQISTTIGLDGSLICQLEKAADNNSLVAQLMQLSLIISSKAETQGGLLIHGALAEIDGTGIIMAGPGEVGKTTASHRLPSPWKSLCDDTTLIIKDKQGFYHAHPWPTWSSFLFGGTGGSWDVQHSVPLKAIFILAHSDLDQVEPLGKGQAVCLLNESAEQASWLLSDIHDDKNRRAMNLQRFNNICELSKKVPSYLLHFTKKGKFWKEIEKILSL